MRGHGVSTGNYTSVVTHEPFPGRVTGVKVASRVTLPRRTGAFLMSSRHPRFTTLCQQLLTLAVVCAALTPAATVMTLELVPEGPGVAGASGPGGQDSAYVAANRVPTRVPTGAVDPAVREVQLTAPAGARLAPGALKARARRVATGTELVSTPQPVDGYGAIGVTWAHGVRLSESQIGVQVRTRQDGAWSAWSEVEYHDEHGPDPDSAEGLKARPGTDPVVVGDVDEVQVKVDTRQLPPSDLSLAVIDPGTPEHTAKELPAIDTGALPSAQTLPDAEHLRGRGRGRAGQGAGDSASGDLLASPVGRQREHARQELAALLRGARRVRAPHGERQRLPAERRPRDPARHLRLPHPLQGLERHRLQLPRRPVRPDLGGPRGRRRPPGRGCAHPRLQRLLVRDVGDRQLRDRPPQLGDAPGLRGAVRLEALAARGGRGLGLAARRRPQLPGDQRAPRRRLDGVPGPLPLRPAAADPPAGGARAGRLGGPAAGVEPGRHAAARPGGAAQERRPRRDPADRAEARRRLPARPCRSPPRSTCRR